MNDPQPMIGLSSEGKPIHYSVGAVIKTNGEYLLMDRAKPPFGLAGPAGHIDENEPPGQALDREVYEETGLTVISRKLIFQEEILWNECRRGIMGHHLYLYECDVKGELNRSTTETKSIGWYSPEDMSDLSLEPIWEYIFGKLGIIPRKLRKITICGSIKFYNEMENARDQLLKMGYEVLIPKLSLDAPEKYGGGRKVNFGQYIVDNGGIEAFPIGHEIWDLKEVAIMDHFEKIEWSDAILVINCEKNGIEGYIGGNTLIEIGMAFSQDKLIFILNNISNDISYKQEVLGMKSIILNGKLEI